MFSQNKNRTRFQYLSMVTFMTLIIGVLIATLFAQSEIADFNWPPQHVARENLAPHTYSHNWDQNPNAYIPEAEVLRRTGAYAHDWDNNPSAYIPDAEVLNQPERYSHHWDDNPVAYVPEAEVIGLPRE